MKKALFLILLLPFIGFSQTLIRWKGYYQADQWNIASTYAPELVNGTTNMSGSNFAGAGINFSKEWEGFQGNSWPTADAKDESKYFQVSINPATGYKITLSQLNFKIKSSGCKSYEVRYSKNASFTNSSLITSGTNLPTGSDYTVTASMTGVNVLSGETLYVRIYMFKDQSGWGGNGAPVQIRFNMNSSSTEGLNFSGTVGLDGGVVANPDTATVTETQSVNIPVILNDTTTGTTINTVTLGTLPAGSSATVGTDKSITFTAPQLTTTTAQVLNFSYTITGADNSTSTANVAVTVNPFASPTVTNYTATTGQNIAVSTNVLAGATAGSGTISSVSIVSATNGTAAVDSNNKVVYTPATGFTGQGVVTYKVTNSNNKSTTGTVTVTVEAITASTATADTYTVAKNTATELNVMSNDNIGNGGFGSIVVLTAPSHGTTTITNTTKITYIPTTNYTGTDSFTYKITSGYGSSATATVNLTVVPPSPTGALCGTYTVGTGGDFATLTAAVNHLNANGVTCNVTFSLINNAVTTTTGGVTTTTGEYSIANGETFPLTINNFTNPGNVYTVTFKPATGKNAVISAGNVGTTWNVTPAVFKINAADNIIFDGSNTANGTTRNLIIKNADKTTSTDRAIIWVASNGTDGAKNITVKNAVINMVKKNEDYAYAVGIFSGNNSFSNNALINDVATADNSGLTVTNNDFVNVKQGVYVNGGSTVTTNVNIKGNDLGAETNTETIVEPCRINNVNGFVFTENLIYNLHRESAGGSLVSTAIYVSGNSSNGTITKNNIKDLFKTLDDGHYFGGIVLESTSTDSKILVANNFILNVAGYAVNNYQGGGHGIIVVSGTGYKIYHNTVLLNTAQHGTSSLGYSAALYVINGSALDVRNNIFVNSQSVTTYPERRSSAIAIKPHVSNINSIFSFLDYNDYYTNNSKFGYITTGNSSPNQIEWNLNPDYVTDFSIWKSVTGKDANSKNVNPTFASATDLHVNGNSAQNNGFADAGTNAIYSFVGKDIDGQVRKAATPDMGADEFGPLAMPTAGDNTGIYCDSATTFTGYVNGVAQWSNGAPAIDKDVIFNADYTQNGGTLYACSVYVLAGKSVNFINNSTANVQHAVNIADTGALTFESGSILIQVENVQNTGTALVKRKGGLLKRLDYTLWCAPVTDNRTTGYQSLLSFSPLTATNPMRFYYYDTATDSYLAATSPETTKFQLGKSVLVRMPNSLPEVTGYNNGLTRFQFEAPFQGTPNNGNIRVPLVYANKNYNGVGNPYPSPISIAAFLQENAVNNGTIVGTLWLWRKTNDSSQTTYSTCTIDGYAANQAPGGTSADGNSFIANPNGVLNTGQGFIVRSLLANKDLVFKNNMRVDSHSTTFFKTQNTNEGPEAVQGGKFWLNAKGGDNWSQMMLSYNNYTSLGYDNGYDGVALNGGNLSLYTLIPAQAEGDEVVKTVIQSRGNFAQADVVPVGYIAAVAGTYEIEIDHAEGIFAEGTDIYIKDNMMGTTQKLNNGSYTFTTTTGTFESRFEIVYVAQGELGTTPVVDAKDIMVYADAQQIKVVSPQEISAVTVYDMLGRTLYTQNDIANTEFATAQLNIAQQVVIVNVTLANKQTVSTKIMMN